MAVAVVKAYQHFDEGRLCCGARSQKRQKGEGCVCARHCAERVCGCVCVWQVICSTETMSKAAALEQRILRMLTYFEAV